MTLEGLNKSGGQRARCECSSIIIMGANPIDVKEVSIWRKKHQQKSQKA
jgi:hypothetical protein